MRSIRAAARAISPIPSTPTCTACRKASGERRSLFRYFQGRSSLATWLRAVLSQRYVDRLRAQKRLAAACPMKSVAAHRSARAAERDPPDPDRVRHVVLLRGRSPAPSIGSTARDRLRLACYYVQELTLADTGRLLKEHEATVSRQLARTRRDLRKDVERQLRDEDGLSEAQIAECFESVSEDAGPLDLDCCWAIRRPRPMRRARNRRRIVLYDEPRVKDMKTERDASIDRLLAGTLEARAAAAPGRRAVSTPRRWRPGRTSALDARERAASKRMRPDCARCQALLAAMVRTVPPPVAARSWWRLPASVGSCRSPPLRRRSSSGSRCPVAAPVASLGRRERERSRSGGAGACAGRGDRAARRCEGSRRSRATRRRIRSPMSGEASAASPTPLRSSSSAEKPRRCEKEAPRAERARRRRCRTASTVAPAAPARRCRAASPRAASAPPLLSPPTRSGACERRSRLARASSFANAAETSIVSSNPSTRFRLLPRRRRAAVGGRRRDLAHRSHRRHRDADGGRLAVTVRLLAGRSGRHGAAVDRRPLLAAPRLSGSRRSASPSPPPTTKTPTVTTADGRTFVTTDGGRTWSRAPGRTSRRQAPSPLQEIPAAPF